jgi:hypothetical protein
MQPVHHSRRRKHSAQSPPVVATARIRQNDNRQEQREEAMAECNARQHAAVLSIAASVPTVEHPDRESDHGVARCLAELAAWRGGVDGFGKALESNTLFFQVGHHLD